MTAKRINLIHIFMPLWLLALATASHAQNLALNPGMEDWATTQCLNWTPVDGASYAQSTTAQAGSYALRVIPTAAYNGVNQNGIPVTAGKIYQVKCWIRGAATGDTQPLRLMVYGYDGGGTPVFPASDTTGNLSDTAYTQYALSFMAPEGLTSINLNITPWDAPAGSFSFLLDEVTVTENEGGLILNGGAENWTGADCDNWVTIDGGVLSQSTDAHSGSYALKVEPNGGYSGTNQGWINLEEGASYMLTCWMKGAQAGHTPGMRLMMYTTEVSPAVFLSKAIGYLSDSEYKQYSLRFTVPAGVSRMVLNVVSFVDSEGDFLIDDVKLSKVDTLIFNGDMEAATDGTPAGADGWLATSFEASAAPSTTALASSTSLAVTPTQTYGGIRQEDIPAQGGTDYRLIAWLAAAGDGLDHPVRLLVIEPGVGWQGLETEYLSMSSGDQISLSSTQWRKVVFDFTTYSAQNVDDTDPTQMHLELGTYDEAPSGVTFLVDKVWLGRVGVDTEPTDPADTSIGGGSQVTATGQAWTLY